MTDATPAADGPWTHHEAHVNGVRLHYVAMGQGPTVLLLHGFPEFWYAWRHQIPALAAAGFRAVAPDLRGYNLSDKPRGVRAYGIETLVDDVAGLIEHLGGRAHVVGHDWGGMVAWYVAMHRPERVDRLVQINAPHPVAFRRELKKPGQMLRSAYVAFFQLPWLPEYALRRRNFGLAVRVFRTEPARPGAYTPDDIRRYREALSQPGALTAMLNYYRALGRTRPLPAKTIQAPTLLLWGDRDPHLSSRMAEGLERGVPRIRVEHLPGASHWVMADEPETVNRHVTAFLREG